MKQMFNISGFSLLSHLISLQTCTCHSPRFLKLLGHISPSVPFWVLSFGSTKRNPGKCSPANQLLPNAYFIPAGQGQDPAMGLKVVLKKRMIAEWFFAFRILTIIPLYSLLSCVSPPCSFCILDLIFAFLMPWKSCSEKGSVEGAGLSTALTDACAGLVCSAGCNQTLELS